VRFAEPDGSGRHAARNAALKRPAAGLRPQQNPTGWPAGDLFADLENRHGKADMTCHHGPPYLFGHDKVPAERSTGVPARSAPHRRTPRRFTAAICGELRG